MESSVSEYFECSSDKSNFPDSCLNLVTGAFFIALVFSLPSGVSGLFDGLPWANKGETLTMAVIIPFLLILGWRFMSLRLPISILGILLVLKVILLFGSPSGGLLVKVYPNSNEKLLTSLRKFDNSENGNWIRTYASSWNNNASGILNRPWTSQYDFPMDWVLSISSCPAPCQLTPIIEIEGALIVPEGRKFALIAQGVEHGTLSATHESGESLTISPAKDAGEAGQGLYQLSRSGRWQVSGKLHYGGPMLSLIPVLVEADGAVETELGRGILWQNWEELSNALGLIGFYQLLSFVTDGGMIVFLLVWVVWTVRSLVQKQILNLPLAVFSITTAFLSVALAPVFAYLLTTVGKLDPTTVSHLGFTIVATSFSFLIWAYLKKDYRSFETERIVPSVFLFFGPALLFFFAFRWWPILGQWVTWGAGDDWTSYQYFARKIVVDGEWLNAGEGVFAMQPLYRYFVGVYHLLFGQSPFAQHMADVWCVLGATALLAGLIMKFRLSVYIAFLVSAVYLTINLVGAFRYHIGRGLVENHAMFFMMLAVWFLYKGRTGGTSQIVLATLFGVFGYWMRQDHLGAIAGLAIFAIEPVSGATGGWIEYWKRTKLYWRRIVLYWGGGIFSVLMLCYRNWYLGGGFFPANPSHPNFTTGELQRGKYYLILTGNEWPNFPSIAGIVVALGVFVALFALVWRPKPLLNFPLCLGITLIGLLAPYALLWTGGYAPRFSIHILPLALLAWGFLLNNIINNYKFPLRFGR